MTDKDAQIAELKNELKETKEEVTDLERENRWLEDDIDEQDARHRKELAEAQEEWRERFEQFGLSLTRSYSLAEVEDIRRAVEGVLALPGMRR